MNKLHGCYIILPSNYIRLHPVTGKIILTAKPVFILNAPQALCGARDASAGAQVGVGGVPRLESVSVRKVSVGSWVFQVWKVLVSGMCGEETEGVGGMISLDGCWSGRPSGWCWWLIGCFCPGWSWWWIYPCCHCCSGRQLV